MPNTCTPVTLSVPLFFLDEMNALLGKPGRVFPSQQWGANPRWPRVTWAVNRRHVAEVRPRAAALAAELRARVATLEVPVSDEGAKVLAEVAGAPGRIVGFLPGTNRAVWAFICPRERHAALQALASILADDPAHL